MSENSRKKSFVVHSEARTLIGNIIRKCDEEALENSSKFLVKQATKRAAYYTGKSESLIKRIRRQLNESDQGKLATPGKHRPTRAENNRTLFVDDFDKCVIRNIVHDFYKTEKVVPTIRKLLPIVQNKIHFPWRESSLRKVLKSIGFKWRKCRSKRRILIEKPEIVNWRYKYLIEMKALRETGREIFYLDETWIDSNITVKKCWQSDEIFGVQENYSAGNRLIVLHAGSASGFLSGAKLIYRAGITTGDYHGQMNNVNFEKWVKEKLVPNLPPNSIVVMDNAPYHSVLAEKVPTKYSVKKDMIDFLQKKGVECDMTMRKEQLVPLIQLHKPREKTFRIDKYISSFNHTVIRLPPYMCDLNAIEYAWASVKNYVRSKNCDGNLCLKRLMELAEEAVSTLTGADWTKYCEKVVENEKMYWQNDGIISDVIDNITISLGDNEDESSSSSDNDEEDDSGSDDEEDSDDYARPLPE
ncbi:uncharacterized protein LOC120351576 [Nilaparvata lugens]|uniref:uncharacterized protein LOC120351576 n=1 Tax=Nilaparvata lugens TaxID=108931 RepID=UPI00193D9EBC|nr:uncharacterized protein LOC120351576 [Nilaparvata lugens]